VLSTAAFGVFASLPQAQFLAWGWRAAFLLSIVLTAVGLCVRLWLEEPPVFADIQERGLLSRAPVLEVLRNQRVTLTLAIGIVFVSIAGFYIVTTFSLSYLTQQLAVARHVSLAGNMVFSGTEAGSMLLFAYIADRLGRGRVAICVLWCLALFSYPYFWLLSTGDYALIWLSMGVAGALLGALYGLTGAFLADLFEPHVRCSGISLGYQLAGLLAGAPAPVLCTLLVRWSDGKTWSVATYLAVSCLITLIAVYAAEHRKCASRSVADRWPAVRLSADP
jgi:MFS family permease